MHGSASITGFLLKVASRCNLNCDYCYVYQHADQTWRNQPKFIAEETVELFCKRLREYVSETNPPALSIVFHGGEPLLCGGERLASIAERVRASVGTKTDVDFSLQTNGVLLTSELLEQLKRADIGVSMSLDGPKEAHDRHRLNHAGATTFDATLAALNLLRTEGRDIFRGVIAVIDPQNSPESILEFFSALDIPRLDLLLPDATHARPPDGRDEAPQLYSNWLKTAFRIWFEKYPNLPLRWFDSVIGSLFGIPCETDVMGFGAVSLLVVDTDGSITDHDVFKIVRSGEPNTGCTLKDHSIAKAASSSRVRAHAALLTFDGIAEECKTCAAVTMCGGGSVMHRYHPTRGFSAPSIYCGEIQALLGEAASSVRARLTTDAPSQLFSRSLAASCDLWAAKRVMVTSSATSSSRLWQRRVRLHTMDDALISPFVDSIVRCEENSTDVAHFFGTLPASETLLRLHSAMLPPAMAALLTDIIVVRSTDPSEEGIFSFSDDSVPDVIYVCASVGAQGLAPEDLADSLYHEFLHHVLYHLESETPLLHEKVFPRFPAPWRAGLRPSGGFFHGTFVFCHLADYWRSLSIKAGDASLRSKAAINAAKFTDQGRFGITALRRYGLLTKAGASLLDSLDAIID